MFKRSKFSILGLATLLIAGCGGTPPAGSESVTLLVWGPTEEQAVYTQLAEAYKAKLPENVKFRMSYADVGEGDAATNVVGDVDTAADIFIFADDQLNRLVENRVLLELPESYANTVTERDSAASVANATNNEDKLVAFPLSDDNGYFLYYNKDYFASTDEVKDLNQMLTSGKLKAGKQLMMDIGNGYYAAAPFIVNGNISYDPDTNLHTCDWNNAHGLAALKGMMAIADEYQDAGITFQNVDDNLIEITKAEPTVVAAISGSWNAEKLVADMGTRIGATKLPTFKGIKADETTYDIQMGAFAGSKLMGVKSSTKFPAYALSFASFLTSEEGQRVRYEAIKRLPTNKVLAASNLTDGNVAADGLQAQAPFAIPQRSSVGGKFWDPSQANGNYIKDATTRELTPQEQLDAFIDAINNI